MRLTVRVLGCKQFLEARVLSDLCKGGTFHESKVCLAGVDTQSGPALEGFPRYQKKKKYFVCAFFFFFFFCEYLFQFTNPSFLLVTYWKSYY
jgi:hypothetical protein